MNIFPFGVLIWLSVITANSIGVLGDLQIQIDKLTSEYIATEKQLWKKIDTQLILIDRGSLLNEIYHEHNQFLRNNFGDSRVLWNLSIQKYEPLINTVLSIDTNAKNIQDYLAKAEYAKLADLAKSNAAQMQQAADHLNATIGRSAFWNDLISSVCNLLYYFFVIVYLKRHFILNCHFILMYFIVIITMRFGTISARQYSFF